MDDIIIISVVTFICTVVLIVFTMIVCIYKRKPTVVASSPKQVVYDNYTPRPRFTVNTLAAENWPKYSRDLSV